MSRLPKYGEVYRAKHGANTVVVRGVFQQRKGDSYHVRVLKGAGRPSDERKRGSVIWEEDFYFTGGDSKKLLAKAVAAAKGASGPGRTSNPFTIGKKDKAVIRAFTEKESYEGHKLTTDGQRLDGHWMGGSGIAEWRGGQIVFTDLGSKAAQTVQRAIKKEAPSSRLGGRWINPGPKRKVAKNPEPLSGRTKAYHLAARAVAETAEGKCDAATRSKLRLLVSSKVADALIHEASVNYMLRTPEPELLVERKRRKTAKKAAKRKVAKKATAKTTEKTKDIRRRLRSALR